MEGMGGVRTGSGPSGNRRIQAGELPARRQSRSYAGMAPSLSRGMLIAAVKAAAPDYCWPRGLVDALDRLVAFSRNEDWRPGRRPVVWPSNLSLADAWGLRRTQVKARIRQLAAAGLIVVAESPNGQRWGRRDDQGRIVEAYGFDLSPLATRYREFAEAAKRLKDERARRSRARRRITIGLRHLAQLVELAADDGDRGRSRASFEAWSRSASETAARGRSAESASDAIAAATEIEALVLEAEAKVGEILAGLSTGDGPSMASAVPESDPMGPPERPPITTTTELPDLSDVQRSQERSSGTGFTRPAGTGKAAPTSKPDERDAGGRGSAAARTGPAGASRSPGSITVGEMLRLAPSLSEHLGSGEAVTWSSLIDAADRLRAALGISRPVWIEACAKLGREGAAMMVGIVAAKRHWLPSDDPGYPRIAGAYFRGLLGRHDAGKLQLGKTIWSMRAAREERLRRVAEGAAS